MAHRFKCYNLIEEMPLHNLLLLKKRNKVEKRPLLAKIHFNKIK